MSFPEPRRIPSTSFQLAETQCPQCKGEEFELRNFAMGAHDGDIHCVHCGHYLRRFDADP